MIGPSGVFLCSGRITIADYVGAGMLTVAELIQCTYRDSRHS
jgi:glutathione S-transferase